MILKDIFKRKKLIKILFIFFYYITVLEIWSCNFGKDIESEIASKAKVFKAVQD